MEVYDIQTESGEYLSSNLRVHNCFILSVEDEMNSILNWYVEEGTIFKDGSGSGINLSEHPFLEGAPEVRRHRLRPGLLHAGRRRLGRHDQVGGRDPAGRQDGRSSTPIIPDVKDFIWCKALEERKARALRESGFDMDLDGKDSHSIQYQNANNSVRVTDEFMQAVLEDRDWDLKAVTTGEPSRRCRPGTCCDEISEAAWDCADPGMQYDTTINDWHTWPNSGPINASNPLQ